MSLWKRPWCWERLMAGGEGGDRGWDGWMASPVQWTWVWANPRRYWRIGKHGVLQLATEQQPGLFTVTGMVPMLSSVSSIIFFSFIFQPWCFLLMYLSPTSISVYPICWVHHVSGIIRYLSFCVWLISLSMMSLVFLYDIVCIKSSFLCKAE